MQTPRADSVDVAVIGAGPAGATAAAALAGAGLKVALLHRDGPRAGAAEETLVPAARRVLERSGALECVELLGFHGRARHASVWSEPVLRVRDEREGERGFQVERRTFDAALRERAARAGAQLVEVGQVTIDERGREVHARTADAGELMIQARAVIVATGRATPDSLAHLATVVELPATLALSTTLSVQHELAQTNVIEAVREGWLWWLPLADGRVELTLFCDREEERGAGREALWSAALRGAVGPAREVQARPERGTLATARLRASAAPILVCGDASCALDPLSSQGLETALASAQHAAHCARSVVEGRSELAFAALERRAWDARLWHAHRRQTTEFLRSEGRFVDAPFWRARQALGLTPSTD
jgi:flavin-dependent dehydrogenase